MLPSIRAGLALLVLCLFAQLRVAFGSVFITHPYEGISCSGGSECIVTWADDGLTPLLAAIGPSDFVLYQGINTLVQQLATGVDVSQSRSLTFVPNPNAGPNADSYWIKMTSLSAQNPNDTSQPYISYSGRFTLENMSGVEGIPDAALTSPLPPSSPPADVQSSTDITNGVVGTVTLPGTIATGSASTLSSALSALSAISSAASGSLSQLPTTTTAAVPTTSASETEEVQTQTPDSENGSVRSMGRTSYNWSTGKCSAAVVVSLLASHITASLL